MNAPSATAPPAPDRSDANATDDGAGHSDNGTRQTTDRQTGPHGAATDQAVQQAATSPMLDRYRSVIDLLPVSVTVEDDHGRLLLANACAATMFGIPRRADFAHDDVRSEPATDGTHSPEGTAIVQSGAIVSGEEKVPGRSGERTLLTSQRRVSIGGDAFVISASVDITAQKAIEAALTRRAAFDELTGLANRATIEHHVGRTLQNKRPGERLALVFIDLDNFKHVNDYYSHAVGDGLLIEVARRLSSQLRESDMLARISGDEFVLLIEPIASDDELQQVIARCLSELKRPFYLEGFEIFTSGSIGVSVFPEHGRTYEVLRRNADSAMYRAKDSVKGDAVFFDAELGSAVTARMALEQQLRLAIRDRHFCCAFQPKVDLRSQDIVGFETLIRWRDDQGIIHPPSAFIGLAVEFGLIDPITTFVVEQSADALSRLDHSYGTTTTISINVAAMQANDAEFMASLLDTLKNTGCADRFMVELTEDAFIAKGHFQTRFLPQLRDLGVKVSIDDFGTGYSSLSVLSDITADELKIDRSFVMDIHQRPRSQSILKAIESLGHSLGMSIVAEGVETVEELAFLQTFTHIRYAQGFYFAKPFYLDDIKRDGHAGGDTPSFAAAREHMLSRNPEAARAGGRIAARGGR